MTELAIILIVVLNIALFMGRSQESYGVSRSEDICFAASVPVGIGSIAALFLLGGPVWLTAVAAATVVFGMLLFLAQLSEGGANA